MRGLRGRRLALAMINANLRTEWKWFRRGPRRQDWLNQIEVLEKSLTTVIRSGMKFVNLVLWRIRRLTFQPLKDGEAEGTRASTLFTEQTFFPSKKKIQGHWRDTPPAPVGPPCELRRHRKSLLPPFGGGWRAGPAWKRKNRACHPAAPNVESTLDFLRKESRMHTWLALHKRHPTLSSPVYRNFNSSARSSRSMGNRFAVWGSLLSSVEVADRTPRTVRCSWPEVPKTVKRNAQYGSDLRIPERLTTITPPFVTLTNEWFFQLIAYLQTALYFLRLPWMQSNKSPVPIRRDHTLPLGELHQVVPPRQEMEASTTLIVS